jgi:hypothetical protein
MLWRRENLSHLQRRSLSGLRRCGRGADRLFSAVIAALRLASAETRTPAQLSEAFATTLSADDMDGFAALFADNCVNHQVSAKTRSLQRLGSCSASLVDVGGSIPSPPTTAGPRHARVSNIWSPAGRNTTCICSDSPHHRGWHICPHNLRLDPHIAARLSLLLPVS